MQPITGPIYRYDETNAQPGAFPRYYDGSWLINNRGSRRRLLEGSPAPQGQQPDAARQRLAARTTRAPRPQSQSGLVIGTQFGPDGSLYMSRFSVGCCRSNTSAADQNQIVKISFNVQDECLTDTAAPSTPRTRSPARRTRARPNTYVNSATLKLTATDSGCAGVKSIEYREQGATDWLPYTADGHVHDGKTYNDRVPRDGQEGQRLRGQDGHVQILEDQRHDRADGQRAGRRATRTSAATSSARPRSR